MRLLPSDQADCVATGSFLSFDDDTGLYERVSRMGSNKYLMLRRPVTFDADVNPTYDVAHAMDKDKERWLKDAIKL